MSVGLYRLSKGAPSRTLLYTHGSFLLADGVDVATVSERLGHSSVRVTADIYSHAPRRGRDQDATRRWIIYACARRVERGIRERDVNASADGRCF
jgi:integrase